MRKRFRKWVPVIDSLAVIFLLLLGGGNFLIGIIEGSFNHHYSEGTFHMILGGFLLAQAQITLNYLKREDEKNG